MRIVNLKANHHRDPIGCDLPDLSLSWTVEGTPSRKAAWTRVVVATGAGFDPASVAYDSGRLPGDAADSRAFHPGAALALSPFTRYHWKVEVAGDAGDHGESAPAFFETGRMGAPFRAHWITADLDPDVHPFLRKEFTVDGDVARARLYATAAGLYEISLNGRPVTHEVLLPGYCAYDVLLPVQTFDVTDLVRRGANDIGAILGPGWFSGRFGLAEVFEIYGDRTHLLAELVVTLADGRETVVGTDGTWRSRPGPVLSSGIYDGETWDASREPPAAGAPDDGAWTGVRLSAPKTGPLVDRPNPPILRHEALHPTLLHTPKGEQVLDFGQNLTGWVEFDLDLPKGARVVLQHGEVMQEGCFYRDNLRSALARFEYVSAGRPAHVRPHFTFFGFRYAKVEGIASVDPARFVARSIRSAMEEVGDLETSDPLVDQLVRNARWGMRGNFLDVPTDCPQRDERLGWTGDAQIFCGTASFFADTAAFYDKWMRDLRGEQVLRGGSVPFFAPAVKTPKARRFDENDSSAWGDVATVLPWTVWLHTGDRAALARHYPLMKDWVDSLRRRDDADGGSRLWKTGFHFGDWLALDHPDPKERALGGTDVHFIASAFYHLSADLVAKAAAALGRPDEAAAYARLADEVREAVRREFFTANGRLAIDTQTAHVLALHFGLARPEHRARLAARLAEKIAQKSVHLDTGFVGTPYLCPTLCETGMDALAYQLLLNKDFPSWLYQVEMGATTIWERWNSLLPDGSVNGTDMTSFNHYAYGSIVEWLVRDVCGLDPDPAAAGYRRAILHPRPYGWLRHAALRYRSASGLYLVGWRFVDARTLRVEAEVPFGCEAELTLPAAPEDGVAWTGPAPAARARRGDGLVCSVGAGTYVAEYRTAVDLVPKLGFSSPLRDLLAEPQAVAALEAALGERIDAWLDTPERREAFSARTLESLGLHGPAGLLDTARRDALAASLGRIPAVAWAKEA